MNAPNKLKWGILSTGNIARTFARGLRDSQSGVLTAVASRTTESARKFADEFGLDHARAYANYDALLADPEVEAVYIATPHPLHADWAVRAALAGKHILCEKPLTVASPDAQRVAAAARRGGVILMEAFMYRCHPQTAKIVDVLRSGQLGEIRNIEATFAFQSNGDPNGRLLNAELGGGGILDVGCYTTSFARLVAGVAQGKEFAEPLQVKALGHIGVTGVDDYTTAVLQFEGGILATCTTGVLLSAGGFARIIGSKGTLRVTDPWFCNGKLILELHGQEATEVEVKTDRTLYAYEADLFAASVAAGKVQFPGQGALDCLGNMRTLDLWRLQIGLKYPQELTERQTVPVGGALHKADTLMRYREMAGIVNAAGAPKQISEVVLGTMLESSLDPLSFGMALFDDFYEQGGTCFDTAYVYGGGTGEKVLGHWLRTRGVGDSVTIIGKGAHTPHCNPEALRTELETSLDRLGLDGVDIYMMHRDNLDIPAGVFVEVLNEQVKAGRMKAFGGSNWTLERLDEANNYAREKGLQGFTVVSNNFSLARLVEPVWAGGVSSSDPVSKAWFEANGLSLFSWSSQARGFFVRGDREFTADAELVRCWYSEDNFERLARAQELARAKGVSPVVIAAAYVLTQKFPIYALIGPRSLAETRDSMDAFQVQLTPHEVQWLNLEV